MIVSCLTAGKLCALQEQLNQQLLSKKNEAGYKDEIYNDGY